MKIYNLSGNAKCSVCGAHADLYSDVPELFLCKKCALALYKELGVHFVPRAIPNVVLRAEMASQKRLSDTLSDVASDSCNTEKSAEDTVKKNNGNAVKTRRIRWQSLMKS